jgi:hypothetical protein
MDRGRTWRGQTDSSASVIELLTTRQHLRPHQPVRSVLRDVIDGLGCCPVAVERAVEWLRVDPDQSIGRLRRSELIQLGNAVARFWHRAGAGEAVAEQQSPR